MRSTPARARPRWTRRVRQCATTGVPSSWAVSQTRRSSSSVQTLTSPFWRGTSPVDMDLDPVDAVLDLAADLGDHLVLVADDAGVADPAPVGDQAPGGAPHRGQQRLPAAGHAGPFDDPGVDGVAQRDADVPQAVGVEEAGDAGAQQLAGRCRRPASRCSPGAVEEQLVVACGSPKVRWQWASIRPGITVAPVASSVTSPAMPGSAARASASAPTAAMRSPSRRTEAETGAAPVPSTSTPPAIKMAAIATPPGKPPGAQAA